MTQRTKSILVRILFAAVAFLATSSQAMLAWFLLELWDRQVNTDERLRAFEREVEHRLTRIETLEDVE